MRVSLYYCRIMLMALVVGCSFLSKNLKRPEVKKKNFSVIWSKNHDIEYKSGNMPISFYGPLIYEGILYIGHNDGKMVAYEIENGRKIWEGFDSGEYHSSPIAYKDQIIYGNVNGRIFSRHYLTGGLKYKLDLGSSIESQGVVYKGRIFFHLRNHKIFCLDVETGKILWTYKRSISYQTTIQRVSRPIVIDGRLYVGFADGYIVSLNVEDGILLWDRKLGDGSKFVDVDASPFYFNGNILSGSVLGKLSKIRPNTGALLQRAEFSISRSPILMNNNLVIGTLDGEVVILDEGLNVKKKLKISTSPIGSLIEWNGNLVVPTNGKLMLLDTNLNILETFTLGGNSSTVFGRAYVNEGYLAVFSSRNRLYVFKSR